MKKVKYSPEQWSEHGAGKSAPCDKSVHVRLSKPGTVQVDIGDGFKNVVYGDEFKIELPRAGKIKCDQEYSLFVGTDVSYKSEGVPLTNMDKRPGMSAVEQIVKAALREKEIRDALKAVERRRANYQQQQKRIAEGLQEPSDEDLVDPDPIVAEPDPVAEPENPGASL